MFGVPPSFMQRPSGFHQSEFLIFRERIHLIHHGFPQWQKHCSGRRYLHFTLFCVVVSKSAESFSSSWSRAPFCTFAHWDRWHHVQPFPWSWTAVWVQMTTLNGPVHWGFWHFLLSTLSRRDFSPISSVFFWAKLGSCKNKLVDMWFNNLSITCWGNVQITLALVIGPTAPHSLGNDWPCWSSKGV